MEIPINPFQAMMDGMGAAWQKERAKNQMTLGELIDTLKVLPGDRRIVGLGKPYSYRGYYEDLAFDPSGDCTVSEALALAESCMGKRFTGYKGGDFVMGENTPIWSAQYDQAWCPRIMAIDATSDPIQLVTAPDDAL